MVGALLFAIVAAALVLRLLPLLGGIDQLLLTATSDDAYYYFQIARNLVEGRGASLDGETPTNGFHPLWLAVVAVFQSFAPGSEAALRAALAGSALLGAATVVLTFAVLRRLDVPAPAALIGCAFVAFHPTAVVESINGLETALVVCTTALVVLSWLGLRDTASISTSAALGFGACGGALLLARTDSALLWGALLVALAVRDRAGLRACVLAGAASGAVAAPWIAWSLLRFGTPVQVSGVALPELLRADFLAEHGDGARVLAGRSLVLLKRAFGESLPHLYLVPRDLPGGAGLAALALWTALPCLAPAGALRERATRRLRRFAWPLVAVIATLGVHAGLRWWTREWYFAPAGWCVAVLWGLGFGWLVELAERAPADRRRRVRAAALATGAACVLLVAATPRARWVPESPHRVQQLDAARWLAAHTPPDARIGAFNAGILAYFSRRTVVNLDGVVNANAYAARRQDRLMDYVLAQQLDYLADWRGTLPMVGCHRTPVVRCERVAAIGEPLPRFAGSPMHVLRVRTAPPPRRGPGDAR